MPSKKANYSRSKEKKYPKIVNIVATGKLPVEELNLIKLLHEVDLDDLEYEPETYPALLGKTKNPRGHVTLYKNGKYIICGVSSIVELNKVYNQLIECLKKIGALK